MNSNESRPNSYEVRGDVAIIGMSCIYPGAGDLGTFWQNIVSKVDAVTDVPPDRWDSNVFYDADTERNDRVYCNKGGFISKYATFDPLDFGIMPIAVDGGDPGQFLTLKVASEALKDAGYSDKQIDPERIEIILGRGNYLDRGLSTVTQHSRIVEQTIDILKRMHPEYGQEEVAEIREELKKSLPYFGFENAPAMTPNITTGRVANRLDFMGPNYTVDAACASSLIAADLGLRDLVTHKCDLSLIGGIFIVPDVPFSIIFTQLGALSKKERITPFDKNADGTVVGEGIGVIVLKRLEDAERDNDRIYAVIKGVGIASDGRALSVTAPRAEGGELAMRRAYKNSGISPETIELIECHGTGTSAGDAAEIEALARVFGKNSNDLLRCGIGTVKSMIGHSMPASGAAGLIKAALALHHKILPPTLNCEEPHPKLSGTPFYVNSETRPWVHGDQDTPRRAGVSAFGFGGINAHVLLEEYTGESNQATQSHITNWDSEVCILHADSRSSLIDRVRELQSYLTANPDASLKDIAYTLNTEEIMTPCRLAVVATSTENLLESLSRALKKLSDPKCTQIRDRKGIYYFEQPVSKEGKLAFLFPGEGAQYVNMLSDLCTNFPEVRACFDEIDEAFVGHERGYYPSQVIFPPPAFTKEDREQLESRIWQMDGAIEAVFTANKAVLTLLRRLELKADVVLGHSTGEFSAMLAAGMADTELERIRSLNSNYVRMESEGSVARAEMVAIGMDYDAVSEIINTIGGNIYVAMDNCPHQVVVVGEPTEVAEAIRQFQSKGWVFEKLSFDRAYHTPLFEPVCEQLRDFFSDQAVSPPEVEAWTCTTGQPYPNDPKEIRLLAADHWKSPVHFRKTIEAMYEDGVRTFVEVGPRGNLTAFVDDILRGKPHLAVPSNLPRRSGIMQLNHLVGILTAQGIAMRLDHLYIRRQPARLVFDEKQSIQQTSSPTEMTLALGFPPMDISPHMSNVHREKHTESRIEEKSPEPELTASEPKDFPIELPIADSLPQAPGGNGKDPGKVSLSTGSRSNVMDQYLQTMDQFLEVQQEVMETYLSNTGHVSDYHSVLMPQPPVEEPVQPIETTEGSMTSQSAPTIEIPSKTERPDIGSISQTVVNLVSERTGYPVEMLGLDLDMEAELGIDSIKRVEILASLQERYTVNEAQIDMEKVADLHTLQEVTEFISHLAGHTDSNLTDDQTEHFAFISDIVSHTPGQELIAHSRMDIKEWIFLHDHTMGDRMSVMDETLKGMSSVPLTVSMEIMAEAASTLLPNKTLIGMKDIRTRRWIITDHGPLKLEIRATNQPSGELEEVIVEIRDLEETIVSNHRPNGPIVEGTMIFGDTYPVTPSIQPIPLKNERFPKFTAEEMYQQGMMFHGPRFQGITRLDRVGEDGVRGELAVIPSDNLFSSNPDPIMVTDPVLIDAAGQFLGYWPQENLERDFLVFPFHIAEVNIYGPRPGLGEQFIGQALVRDVNPRQIRADIDVFGTDGRPLIRIIGWEDRRFPVNKTLFDIWRDPQHISLSNFCKAASASLPTPDAFTCHKYDQSKQNRVIARELWIRMIFNREERQIWRGLKWPLARCNNWFLGRWVAKDAIRAYMQKHYGLSLCPADIEITPDEHGRPIPHGKWTADINETPMVSIAHTNNIAVAIVGKGQNGNKIGIDVEEIKEHEPSFENQAFTPEELNLLASLDQSRRSEWIARFWCAKEAVAKALGRGFMGNPHSLAVCDTDADSGTIRVSLRGKQKDFFPEYAEHTIVAYTTQDENYIIATSLCERS